VTDEVIEALEGSQIHGIDYSRYSSVWATNSKETHLSDGMFVQEISTIISHYCQRTVSAGILGYRIRETEDV
jgi:hypothetical protein